MTAPGVGPGRLLTPRGWIAAGCGATLLALGLWWRYAALLGLGAGLVLALTTDLILVAWRLRLRVVRRLEPVVVQRRDRCTAWVRIEGRLPLLSSATLSDRVGRSEVSIELDARVASHRVPTARRGLLRVGPLRLRRVGPFGLASTTRGCGAPAYVRILPRSIPLHELVTGRRRSLVGADESLEHGGTDLLGLHEYAPGDDLRRLHWATSARTGTAMIRDDVDPAAPRLTVVIDDYSPHYGDSEGTEFEDVIEVAYALCRRAIERGLPVHLVSTSGGIDVPVGERLTAVDADARYLYTALADLGCGTTTGRARLHRHSLDTVVVLGGSLAPVDDLIALSGSAATTVIGQVDLRVEVPSVATPRGDRAVTALRAPDSMAFARLWDRVIG